MGAPTSRTSTDLACRTALAYRGVAHLTVPGGSAGQRPRRTIASKRNVAGHVSDVWRTDRRLPCRRRTCAGPPTCSTRARRSRSSAGRGALDATDELEQLADLLAAPNHQGAARQGRGARRQPVHHRAASACSARGRRRTPWRAATRCSSSAARSPTSSSIPKPGQARGVQIDLDPDAHRPALSGRGRTGRGQPRARCRSCCRCSSGTTDRSFLETAQGGMEEWWQLMEERGTRRRQADEAAGGRAWSSASGWHDDAIVSRDSGTITTWFARHIRARRGQMLLAAPATWRPWPTACPTRSPPRSPIPSASRSRSSATAVSRC